MGARRRPHLSGRKISAETFRARRACCSRDLNRKAVVHAFAPPECHRRVRIDVNPFLSMSGVQLAPIRQRPSLLRSHTVEGLPVRLQKAQRAIVENLNLNPAFVHLPMVEATEQRQVRQLRLASFRPVPHVMGIDVPRV